MKKYSVKHLSELANVSIRTLHHYDSIDLLSPSDRSEKGYRFYGRDELFKLQQILFYKALGLSLNEIAKILEKPDFDIIKALESHRIELKKKCQKFELLLQTIDKTIKELKTKDKMMTDKEIYAGFDPKKIKSIRDEVKQKWGNKELESVESRIKSLGKSGWDDHKKKGEEINQTLAELMVLNPDNELVQQTISLHHKHLNFYYEVTKERYLALGKMYTEDNQFTAFYEKYGHGLATFIYEAIKIYCK